MGQKVKDKNNQHSGNDIEQQIHPVVEGKLKKVMKIMSWVVGISFSLIIILPNFEFTFVDEIVKFLFFLGLINLLLFAILEFFAHNIKVYFSKAKYESNISS